MKMLITTNTPEITIPRLLSRNEVCRIIGISPSTVKRYGRAGLLNPIKIGTKLVRYDLEDVQKLKSFCASLN